MHIRINIIKAILHSRILPCLQALQFSLQNERLDLLKQVAEKQLNLSLLTGDTLMKPIQPLVEAGLMDRFDVGKD